MPHRKPPFRWELGPRAYNALALLGVLFLLVLLVSLSGVHLDRGHLLPALGWTAVFAAAAWLLRGVTLSGALAGAGIAFLLYLTGGPAAFLTLLSVFLLSLAATRFGYGRKRLLGVAEQRHGRTAAQVVANLFAASLFSLFAGLPGCVAASVAALAEAAADTVSSEIGQAVGKDPVLITTFKPVAIGADGGISLPGTAAGLVAALAVSVMAVKSGWLPSHHLLLATGAGFFGMLLDSVLGATLERRGRMNNDAVNFGGTAVAALLAVCLARL